MGHRFYGMEFPPALVPSKRLSYHGIHCMIQPSQVHAEAINRNHAGWRVPPLPQLPLHFCAPHPRRRFLNSIGLSATKILAKLESRQSLLNFQVSFDAQTSRQGAEGQSQRNHYWAKRMDQRGRGVSGWTLISLEPGLRSVVASGCSITTACASVGALLPRHCWQSIIIELKHVKQPLEERSM